MKFKSERLSYLVDAFERVLKGEKLQLNRENQFVYDLLADLYQKRMLSEKPEEYFKSDTYDPIGDTSNSSLPYQATTQRGYYRRELKNVGVSNIRIIGTTINKITEKKIKTLQEYSAANLLPLSPSIQGIFEFLYLLNKKEIEPDFNKNFFVDNKSNENSFFNAITREVAISQEKLSELGVEILNGAKDIANRVKDNYKKTNFNKELEFEIETGANILYASSSDKKIWEAELLENFGLKIKDLSEVIGNFPDAAELHGTIESNAVGNPTDTSTGKLFTIINKIKLDGKEALLQRLQKLGLSAEKTFIAVDDRASKMSEKITIEFLKRHGDNLPPDIYKLYFENYSFDELPRLKVLPGAEVKHFIDAAGGITDFWKEITDISRNLAVEDRYIENASAMAVMPILDVFADEPRILTLSAKNKSGFRDIPQPNLAYIESEQFTYPIYNKDGSKNKTTLTEMMISGDTDSYINYSDIGLIFKSLANLFELKNITTKSNESYKGYQIGVFTSDEVKNVNGFQAKKLDAADTLIATKADSLIQQNSCFIFDGNIKPEDFSKISHAFNKIVVNKQTDPRDKKKQIIIHNPNEHFQKIIDLYGKGYDVGTIKQYPPRMFSITHSDDELEHLIDVHSKKYRPVDFQYNYSQQPQKIEPLENREAVFIACSASSDTPKNLDLANRTAFLLALSGKDIVYGSGDKKMMGGIYTGYFYAKEYAEKNGIEFKSRLVASSTPNILKLETLNENKPEKIEDELFYLAPTIDHRKDFLFNSSTSAIILPGGAGTVEELFMCAEKAKLTNRDYDINVLNIKKCYDILEQKNDDKNIKFFSDLDRILLNKYKVGAELKKSGIDYVDALKFLKQNLSPSTKLSELNKDELGSTEKGIT